MNSQVPLDWTQDNVFHFMNTYAIFQKWSDCWACGALPLSSIHRTALVTVTLRRTWFSKDMKSQVQAMADSTSPSGTALWNWVLISTWWKLVLMGSLILPLLLFWPLYSKLSLLLCNVSHLEVIKLQMVMEMKPKIIYQGPLDRPTGGD